MKNYFYTVANQCKVPSLFWFQVPFFSALLRFRDHITGRSAEPLEDHEVVFANVVLKNQPRKVKQEQDDDANGEQD